MFADFAAMSGATAAVLAQIIPVLFLTLLFEIRVRPSVEGRSALGIVLGFMGNLVVASGAVLVEFGLLRVVQTDRDDGWGSFLWWGSFVLFVLVVVRWIATTTVAKIVADNSDALKRALSSSVSGIEISFSGLTIVVEVLAAPSQVFAEVLKVMGSSLVEVGRGLLAGFGIVIRRLPTDKNE